MPRLPRIANFDDLDPLAAEPDVASRSCRRASALPGDADLVILPGSKATLADLAALRAAGLGHRSRGPSSGAAAAVLGLCGGYQMLGARASPTPDGIEGPPGEAAGLGLLDVATTLARDKRLAEVAGTRAARAARRSRGYEMHIGETTGPALARPMLELGGRPDGAVSADGRVMGCYLHGLFAADGFRHAFLARLRAAASASGVAYEARIEATLDALADHLEAALDLDGLLELARSRAERPAARAAAQQTPMSSVARSSSRSARRMSAAVAAARPPPIQASSTSSPA